MAAIEALVLLRDSLVGELHFDELHKTIYATDASAYRIIPTAVALPKNEIDLKKIVYFAKNNNISLTLRTAGTSLAGQTVGSGIIVDVSKYFTNIISFDEHNKTIIVQPGVIRDELNLFLKPYGLFFGPNTSTSNRCMIGGMVGNNSSGTTSIRFGVTRDKIVSLKTILSDGSEVEFSELTSNQFLEKVNLNTLEGTIYKFFFNELSNKLIQEEIISEFPHPEIHRRNTGYAVDELLKSDLFGGTEPIINIAKLLCGSEGTLAITTEITLKLDTLPPTYNILIASHFNSIQESLEATVIAMKHNLYSCELMDKTVLDLTKNNREHIKNRFFIKEDPKAVLMLEVASNSLEDAEKQANSLIQDLTNHGFGYAHPKIYRTDIDKVISLRKAGLGLLGSIVGDEKAADSIEDTAVKIEDLPNYIAEFTKMMDSYGQKAIYYAHAGAGELHLRPILNLKKKSDVVLFRTIAFEVAKLVKKYKGSLSGEHGDGMVRGEFIPFMIGKNNYELLKRLKITFDPNNILNPSKIVDAPPMDENLRFVADRNEPEISTLLDFSDSLGVLRASEKCNGSGDCRKLISAGGTMCPSYRATLNEKDTTRARANALREFLTNSNKTNKFNQQELYDILELCISCKACASECPSNVDMATLKAEFLYQYQKENGSSLRTKLFAFNYRLNHFGILFPAITNYLLNLDFIKKLLGIANQRTIPKLQSFTLRTWINKNQQKIKITNPIKKVYLFIDEYTNFYDVEVGIDTIKLLTHLNYEVLIINHEESGRSFISKGFLKQAKKVANKNIDIFKNLIDENTPLIGIEPSAILGFRDEYIRLADDKKMAKKLAINAFTIEEFIKNEIDLENIYADSFNDEHCTIKIHGHCHQKSLSSIESTQAMLSLPKNYQVTILNTGCCGMAGAFGYEKEHYEFSMQIGETSVFPRIRNLSHQTEIASAGTSCRHQIYDGTRRVAEHPITILKNALK
ncbi:MAG: FAD-linked oxidase C-terminal domain-containing protein [Flavobacteriaceae bacterium]|nr:FAD-linked oxidase C-terminal domain-containing protein [Flavobacteriaceae bacterium]